MDLRWQEEQRAFQARILIDESPDLALRPYRTFVGTSAPRESTGPGRAERLIVLLVFAAVVVTTLLAVGIAREFAALAASFIGGVFIIVAVSPPRTPTAKVGWTPLLALYSPSVMRGARPVCVTQISVDELDRLGIEGFGTVVGEPRPGSTFGLFVDNHLVWPRTPPRGPVDDDPGFGAA